MRRLTILVSLKQQERESCLACLRSHTCSFTKWRVSTRMQRTNSQEESLQCSGGALVLCTASLAFPCICIRGTDSSKGLQAGRQSCCFWVGGSQFLSVLQGHKWIWGNQEICGHKVSATLSTPPHLPPPAALIIPDHYLYVCTGAHSSIM